MFIDLHEMGTDATYRFTFGMRSLQSLPDRANSTTIFIGLGKNNAKYFDMFGFSIFFTRENYDAFYPGYGATLCRFTSAGSL